MLVQGNMELMGMLLQLNNLGKERPQLAMEGHRHPTVFGV